MYELLPPAVIRVAAMVNGTYFPSLPRAIVPHCVVPKTRPRAELGTLGGGSVLNSHLQTTTSQANPMKTLAYVNRACSGAGPEWRGTKL